MKFATIITVCSSISVIIVPSPVQISVYLVVMETVRLVNKVIT